MRICRGSGFEHAGAVDEPLDRLVIRHAPDAPGHGLECLAEAPAAPELALLGGDYALGHAVATYPHASQVRRLEVGESPRGPVPFDALPRLVDLHIWQNAAVARTLKDAPDVLQALEIKMLPGRDLTALGHLRGLETLTISAGQALKSFQGLAGCISLREFTCHATRAMTDADHLPASLEVLGLIGCRQLASLDCVRATPELSGLFLDDCGDLPDLEPVRQLLHLARLDLLGQTVVADGRVGDLAARLGERFIYADKPHYDRP